MPARSSLRSLDGRTFDVAVIGAGVAGAAAAQNLVAAGYSVLLVDKGDFASGSSSRSSRLLHCGLRYLAPGASMFEFVRHPSRLATALSMARTGMQCRTQFANATPERIEAHTYHFPLYDDMPYKPWQLDLAFATLRGLDPRGTPLDYARLKAADIKDKPLLGWLRDPDRLKAVVRYREYRFDWPERIVIDSVMDAERLGACVRNYTAVANMARDAMGWALTLQDALDTAAPPTTVTAKLVLNMAGVWIDKVNKLALADAPRRITGTKGIHFMLRLPADCRGLGVATLSRVKEPIYIAPWGDLHYVGPTETLYEGDPDNVQATDDEIDFLLSESNHLLPGARFRREDILFVWAGVRPLSYDPAQPMGARARTLHDLGPAGLPDVLAMTATPIMTHRDAGREVTDAVAKRIQPSGTAAPLSYAARTFPQETNAPLLDPEIPGVTTADLRFAAETEHPATLADLLFRRVKVGWTATMGAASARFAAETVADIMGWDNARIDAEVAAYQTLLKERHRAKAAG